MWITKKIPHGYSEEENKLLSWRDFIAFSDEENFYIDGLDKNTKIKNIMNLKAIERGSTYKVSYTGTSDNISKKFGKERTLKVLSFSYFGDKGILYFPLCILYQDVNSKEYVRLKSEATKFKHVKTKR